MIFALLVGLIVIWSAVGGLVAVIAVMELSDHLEAARVYAVHMEIRYGSQETISYDPIEGDVQIVTEHSGTLGSFTELVKIRQGLLDKAILQACVAELERLGYTVIPPENSD